MKRSPRVTVRRSISRSEQLRVGWYTSVRTTFLCFTRVGRVLDVLRRLQNSSLIMMI